MATFGVDEAGKGPVLGPMVAASIVADPADLPAGIDDSKRLTPARREELVAEIRADDAVTVGVARVGVDRIDDPATDMNSLTVAAHAEALAAALGEHPDDLTGVVDAGDVDAARFARRVADAAPGDLTVTAEHGADGTYAVVGAASVVAKVERDAAVAALKQEYGEIGSGYPSDETTRAFLRHHVEEHGSLPACARHSWQTSRDALAAVEQGTLEEF